MHIGAKWRELAQRHGDHAAIVDDRGSWSYPRCSTPASHGFGNALAGLGLRKGDRVALLVPDIREYLEADYAIMSAGFVRVPLDPRLTGGELAALLRYAGATALVTHASFAPTVTGLTDEVESLRHIVCIGGDGSGDGLGHDYEALLARASDRPLPEGDGDDLATLNFTGGTTGAPKAAMLRHRNLMAVARNTIHGFEISGDSVFLNVRPLWPIAQVILMSHLFAGATVVLRRFDPEKICAARAASGRDADFAGADAVAALPRSPAPGRRAAPTTAGDLCRRLTHSARGLRARARDHRPEDRRALRADRSAHHLLPAAASARGRRRQDRAHPFRRTRAGRL